MMYFIRLFRKIIYDVLSHKCQTVFIFVVVLLILCISHLGEMLNNIVLVENDNLKLCEGKIDVVYTWVNGSDKKFRENINKFLNKDIHKITDYSDERFDDKYELKFSLRSLEKYAPWVNHVYIVTNGQIPYWLNLDYEKVSIVTHDEIFRDLDNLPTFSSPSIESNLHRIPGLSKKFIYLNDDIFLGAPVYPDDFFSLNRGFVVYLAWPLPSCVSNCPWVYVGDGQCDSSCYNVHCQFDGGDCDNTESRLHFHHFNSHHDYEDEDDRNNFDYEYFEENLNIIKRDIINKNSINGNKINKSETMLHNNTIKGNDTHNNKIKGNDTHNNTIKNDNNNNNNKVLLGSVQIIKNDIELNKKFNNHMSMTTGLKTNKITTVLNNKTSVLDFVKQHNSKILLTDKLTRKKRLYKSLRKRKKIYNTVFNTTNNINNTQTQNVLSDKQNLDTYALSLQHTNRVFNLNYGFKMRKVPAHAPILIDRDIMNNLQIKFEKEIKLTQKNRFRSANDIQFSFSYYYYLMNEKIHVNTTDIFDEFDMDSSGTWSDREIRTILTKVNDLPLNYGMVETFDNAIFNCSKHIKVPEVAVPPYERYIDSKLPTVSKELVLKCPAMVKLLDDHFGVRQKYNFEVIKNAHGNYVMFKMLTSNVSDVVGHLDEIRKVPRKFVCLNDNMNLTKTEDNDLVKAILLDFYISLFPKPSKFELPLEFRNRFLYVEDLHNWKNYHTKLKFVLMLCVVILLGICVHNICKRRLVRQVKNIIYS